MYSRSTRNPRVAEREREKKSAKVRGKSSGAKNHRNLAFVTVENGISFLTEFQSARCRDESHWRIPEETAAIAESAVNKEEKLGGRTDTRVSGYIEQLD